MARRMLSRSDCEPGVALLVASKEGNDHHQKMIYLVTVQMDKQTNHFYGIDKFVCKVI